MGYSKKKPYQRMSYGIRQFYRAPARHLKDSIGPESVFEKPYLTKEYVDLQQSPNVPEIPPSPGGVGGLECLYNPNECEITAGCYAGPEIKITGGPEELTAGYLEPKILEGALVSWSIAADRREINLLFDPGQSRNVIQVDFKDGWGDVHSKVLIADCTTEWVFYTTVGTDHGRFFDSSLGGASGYPAYTNSGGTGHPIGYNETDTDWFINESCFNFKNIVLLKGGAYISVLKMFNRYQYDTITELKVYGLDEDNGVCPANVADWLTDVAGNLTSASVDWDFTNNVPAKDEWMEVDVSSIVQEIMGRAGWSSGNNIVFFILNDQTASGVGPASRSINQFYTYDINSNGPRLLVT